MFFVKLLTVCTPKKHLKTAQKRPPLVKMPENIVLRSWICWCALIKPALIKLSIGQEN